MLRRLPDPEGNATVLNTAADPEHIQALYLWEEGNVPARTRFTENMSGYFDPCDFRPYVTAIPVRAGVQPKGAVVLMAGGAYQFRGNYTDSLPTARRCASWASKPSLWITACRPTRRRRARWMSPAPCALFERMRLSTVSIRRLSP